MHNHIVSPALRFTSFYSNLFLSQHHASTAKTLGKWNLRLASAPIMIVVELIQIVSIHTPPSTTIKRRPVILKGIKVLSCKRNKLFEVGVTLALGAKF